MLPNSTSTADHPNASPKSNSSPSLFHCLATPVAHQGRHRRAGNATPASSGSNGGSRAGRGGGGGGSGARKPRRPARARCHGWRPFSWPAIHQGWIGGLLITLATPPACKNLCSRCEPPPGRSLDSPTSRRVKNEDMGCLSGVFVIVKRWIDKIITGCRWLRRDASMSPLPTDDRGGVSSSEPTCDGLCS